MFSYTTSGQVPRTESFDSGWKFIKDGSVRGAEQPGYDDSKWRSVDLPHDWSIEDLPQQIRDSVSGPFTKASVGKTASGYVEGGIGWYRKKFALGKDFDGKQVSIQFDGVYMNADVWINGKYLGNHPYGYTSFYYDITPYCKPSGQENVIVVRVVNNGRNTRWYSGSGIYRHVWLTKTDKLHIGQWGVYITTPLVTTQSATVKINSTIDNKSNDGGQVVVQTQLYDGKEKVGAPVKTLQTLNAAGETVVMQTVRIKIPKLWSISKPHLYTVEVTVSRSGKIKDKVVTTFGVRNIEFSAERGFILNGEKVLLHGGCVHHDNGPLGSAAIDRAEERKIELLKANGYNAVRCSHNPPSQAFLEACDRLGMLVIDEAFDMWQKQKNPQDYHLYFDSCWQRDISSMVMRDRNHPSIIMWSIGNEIEERADSSGIVIGNKLRNAVRSLDTTRKITMAVHEFWDHPGRSWDSTYKAFNYLDVAGYNYEWWHYETDHAKYPDRIIMGTESVPQHAYENWAMVEKLPYVIGDFTWTAMDYLGETGIGHYNYAEEPVPMFMEWPWINGFCGDIDLIGQKKPQSYFRDVVWRKKKIAMAVHAPVPANRTEKISYWGWPNEEQSWNWQGNEGKNMKVIVYSRCRTVRLTLNGKLIGEKNISDSVRFITPFDIPYSPGALTAIFEVPYTAGTLTAYALENGKVIDSFLLSTTGKVEKLKLIADRNVIKASKNDLSYITVEVADGKGNVVPDAALPVQFEITGPGKIVGVANGDPKDASSMKQPVKNAYKGKCLVIVQPNGSAGKIVLRAKATGLQSGEIDIVTK